MIRYGKSAQDILGFKQDFFESNDRLRDDLLKINRRYAEQPRRILCKLCTEKLPDQPKFTKHEVKYFICTRCGHLNGAYEDTKEFCSALYADDSGRDYAKTYSSSDKDIYFKRVEQIYVPKAKFLAEALREQGAEPNRLTYTDLGAGSGYFVAALRGIGLDQVTGYEVSESQVDLATKMLSGRHVVRHELDALDAIIQGINSDVVSMIGVLEHVTNPREVLERLCANKGVEYVYISVPLFSTSVFIEMAFPDVMPRHLAAAHTHLFTESSLRWMANEYKMDRVSEWWFGTDIVDLFRSMTVMLQKSSQTHDVATDWQSMFAPLLDEMQIVLDKRKMSSEIHALFKLKR